MIVLREMRKVLRYCSALNVLFVNDGAVGSGGRSSVVIEAHIVKEITAVVAAH